MTVDEEFGMTNPFCNCAKKHGVDPSDALMIADNLIHLRALSERIVTTYNNKTYRDFRLDMYAIAARWRPAFH